MPIGIPVNLSIPADSELGPALIKAAADKQKSENKSAKSEDREPRTITIQETILSICAEQLGVNFDPPKRGRRWPAKTAE